MRRRSRQWVAGFGVLGIIAVAATGAVGVPALADPPPPSPVVAAVGDFACDPADSKYLGGLGTDVRCRQLATSNALLSDALVGSVLGLGDFQYDCGDPADWAVSYHPTWGRLGDRMVPVVGNHEYKTGTDAFGSSCPASNSTAAGYFSYFGSAAHPETAGHFSFDLGSWHLVGLNAQCTRSGAGGCTATSSQTTWLTQDLATTTQPCVLAFWHQPLFTGLKSPNTAYRAWWSVLQSAHVDVVLNGHVHNYQRYGPLLPDGTTSPDGITEYVVGTGGEAMASLNAAANPQPLAYARTFGYLRLTLQPTGWMSEFVSSTGAVLDTSSGTCH